MPQLEHYIARLRGELETASETVKSLLKERDTLKQAYSMQIDLVKALEDKIDKLTRKK